MLLVDFFIALSSNYSLHREINLYKTLLFFVDFF